MKKAGGGGGARIEAPTVGVDSLRYQLKSLLERASKDESLSDSLKQAREQLPREQAKEPLEMEESELLRSAKDTDWSSAP